MQQEIKGQFRQLVVASLEKALKEMSVGETCIAPKGVSLYSVRRGCSTLKNQGYLFSTATKEGVQIITRIK